MGTPNVEGNSHEENSVPGQRVTVSPVVKDEHTGYERSTREYRRESDDALIKREHLFCGKISKIEFGPGATDADLERRADDPFMVSQAKMRELSNRRTPEQKAADAEREEQNREERERRLDEMEAQRVVKDQKASEKAAELRKEIDIVKRAKKLFAAQQIQYQDVKMVRKLDSFITQPLMTDENKLCVLNALFDGEDDLPHRDHYRGRIVDHEDKIIDEFYPVTRLVAAFSAAGLSGVSLKAAREVIKEFALDHERNDLIDRLEKKIPEWDGKSRMKKKLIELFELRDTPLIQNVGQYFFLSLYNRVMIPGSLAPIAIALIGAQGCGKSLFAKKLCQIITGNDEADSVQLNLDGDWMEFLRAITGNSVIATVGEMAGFTRADTNKIKDITTRVSDQMHQKFEGTFQQQRQWIMMLDGNKYELQRDETGNRRFMPLFCGQLEDVGGQPRWRQDFEAIFDDKERGICFEDDVWQIMAECAEWMDENGESGYEAFVREVVRQVLEFNKGEMAAERGIVVDGDIETYLDLALSKVKLEIIPMRDGSGSTCVRVDRVELLDVIHTLSNGKAKIHPNGLRKAMAARGADEVKPSGVPKYRFAKLADQAAFDKRMADRNPSMDDEAAKVQEERF